MRARLLVGTVALAMLAVTLAAPTAYAENDPYGVITDADGTRWVTMSVAEFLALPPVARLERTMLARASGDFRAGDDSATDDDPQPLWTVVQVGTMTRVLDRRGSARIIRYVGPERECVRTARKGKPYSISSDRLADFTCRPRSVRTVDGRDYVRGFMPSALAEADLPAEARVLVREADLDGSSGAGQSMRVAVRDASLVRTLGLYGGPGIYADYDVTSSGISTEFDVSNGISWSLREFQLSTRGVPDLPRRITRQVR